MKTAIAILMMLALVSCASPYRGMNENDLWKVNSQYELLRK